MPRIASHPTFPSVTEVLAAAGLVRDYRNLDDRYSLLGQALHETIAWHHWGTLDEASIHPEVKPGFEGYLEWIEHAAHFPLFSELELVHEGYGFVGHVDRVGSIGSEERTLIDWTYSDSPDWRGKRWQVGGGYSVLWNTAHPEQPITRKFVVAFTKQGRYKQVEVSAPYNEQVFLAALIVERAKREK
jgi:hypothetical protein